MITVLFVAVALFYFIDLALSEKSRDRRWERGLGWIGIGRTKRHCKKHEYMTHKENSHF